MSNELSNYELFRLAIAAEKLAEKLYRGLAELFAHHQAAADFLLAYAREEATHAEVLTQIRDSLSKERLAASADSVQLKSARHLLDFSVEDELATIDHFEEAYELVSQVEHSETNLVFDFLITNFSTDKKVQGFMRSQLNAHIGRLTMGLPAQLKHAAERSEIKARRNVD